MPGQAVTVQNDGTGKGTFNTAGITSYYVGAPTTFANVNFNTITVGQTLATIAALRAVPITSAILQGYAVNVVGYYAANDGGGGLYVWNSTSTATDNGGTVIQATGVATGRWLMQFTGPLNAKWFGVKGDGATDDTTSLIAAINAADPLGRAVLIPTNCNVKITSRLDSLTTADIRLISLVNCFKDQAETNVSLPTITCSGTALLGAYDLPTDTLTFTSQLKLLSGLVIKSNGANVGLVTLMDAGTIEKCHFDGFAYHGIIDCGSVISNIGPVSFYNCGQGRTTSNALNADNFVDGCAILSVGSCTSGVNGNMATSRTFSSSNYGGSKIYDIAVFTNGTPTTSFKGFIGFNQRDTILRVRGYAGVWLGYCDVQLQCGHLEVYATGGAVANDGNPYALVTLNSSPRIEDTFMTVSPLGSAGPVRFYRTTPFDVNHNWWGYEVSLNDRRAMSRAQIKELVLGDYQPDSGSYTIPPITALGTANNPIIYYDTTLNCLLVSKGNHYYPLVAMPQFQNGALANGANVTTTFPAYSTWDIGGATGQTDGGVVYDAEVLVAGTSGQVFHHSVWRIVAMNISSVAYKVGGADPVAGVTVTASGPNLNIANATGFSSNYMVQYKLVGPATGSPSN